MGVTRVRMEVNTDKSSVTSTKLYGPDLQRDIDWMP